MSRIKQFIELSSLSLNTTEIIEGSTQKCKYCNGNGFFYNTDNVYESDKSPCPMCGGSGKLIPVITIEWKKI